MKNLFYLFIVIFIISGCSYKNEEISLKSYEADYIGEVSKDNKSVYIKSVKDTRIDKRSLGYILKNTKRSTTLYSDVDFAQKYREGLSYALNLAEFNTKTDVNEAYLVVDVNIKEIELIYYDKSFDENLKGKIEIEVIIKKGKEVITQNFIQKGGKWIGVSYSSKDLEPFLYTLFSDSINDIISRLTRI